MIFIIIINIIIIIININVIIIIIIIINIIIIIFITTTTTTIKITNMLYISDTCDKNGMKCIEPEIMSGVKRQRNNCYCITVQDVINAVAYLKVGKSDDIRHNYANSKGYEEVTL